MRAVVVTVTGTRRSRARQKSVSGVRLWTNFAPRCLMFPAPHHLHHCHHHLLLLPLNPLDKDEPRPDLGFDDDEVAGAGGGGAKSATDGRDSVGFGEDSFGIEDESLVLPGGDSPVKPAKKEPAVEDKPKPKEEPVKPKASVDEDR